MCWCEQARESEEQRQRAAVRASVEVGVQEARVVKVALEPLDAALAVLVDHAEARVVEVVVVCPRRRSSKRRAPQRRSVFLEARV